MADLRAAFADAGYEDVRTYVQSGNIVVGAAADPAELEGEVQRLIADRFGFDVPVIARSRDELAAVVALNPLKDIATNPKRYQVSFLSEPLPADVVETLRAAATGEERLVAHGRELYAWHPDGVARSKMWNALAGKSLGPVATARNWTTVTTLLAMADE